MTRIIIDDTEVQDLFSSVADTQMPFILSTMINGLLQDSQLEVIRGISGRFVIRRPEFLRRTIKIRKFAKKRDLLGELATDGPGADIFAKFEEGGVKTPSGQSLAIPIDVKTNKRDLITAGNRPRALISAKKAFIIRSGPGTGLIIQRYGRGKRKTRVLYGLARRATIVPRLEFIDTVVRTFKDRFNRQFNVAYTNAMRTAR